MAVCKACAQPLVLDLDPDDFDEATSSAAGGPSLVVPDDLELLACHCRFHWQCLLDEASTVVVSLKCPSCQSVLTALSEGPSATNNVLSAQQAEPRILTRYINEGGTQDKLDILPLVTEEAYLDANPIARPARAFLTMCGEGDVSGILELLETIQKGYSGEGGMRPSEMLRYQDPLDGSKCALHLAVERDQVEIAWLLLWLASGLNVDVFPEQVLRAAQSTGAERKYAKSGPDIRTLKDSVGRTAGEIAGDRGPAWTGLISNGCLKAQ